MTTFQVSRELHPSKKPSHSQPPHPLRPSSASSFGSFGSSAPSIFEQYQPLPTCGDTCLLHHHCGVHSLWNTWGRMTSNPYNIHISRCFLLLYKLSSRYSSAPPPSVYRLGLCCPGIEGPAKLNPTQRLLL